MFLINFSSICFKIEKLVIVTKKNKRVFKKNCKLIKPMLFFYLLLKILYDVNNVSFNIKSKKSLIFILL